MLIFNESALPQPEPYLLGSKFFVQYSSHTDIIHVRRCMEPVKKSVIEHTRVVKLTVLHERYEES
jgi:hypothetical protein